MAHTKIIGRRRGARVGGPNHGTRPTRGIKKGLRATRIKMRAGLIKP
jgi:hypothetical protein